MAVENQSSESITQNILFLAYISLNLPFYNSEMIVNDEVLINSCMNVSDLTEQLNSSTGFPKPPAFPYLPLQMLC